MTYGLLSALCWGVSALMAAAAARWIGALRTLAIGEAVALAGYGTLFWAGHFSLRGAGPTAWLLILAGMIGVVGYLALYRGLESGHIGLVSAISACYGGVTAVLSVLLLHERLTAAAVAGIVATVAGVMLAVIRRSTVPEPAMAPESATVPESATDPEPATVPESATDPERGTVPESATVPESVTLPVVGVGPAAPALVAPAVAAPAIGAVFGLAAALFYGVSGFMIGRYSRDLGWLVPVVIARSGAMVFLLGLLATPLRAPSPVGAGRGRGVSAIAWAMAAGLVDAAGLAAFSRGDQVGLVALTAAVSSAYPVIPLIGGLLLFRERLRRWQAAGAVLILAGLVLLGLGS
jgi:drug/metabolite transporter (DMT)-like permease